LAFALLPMADLNNINFLGIEAAIAVTLIVAETYGKMRRGGVRVSDHEEVVEEIDDLTGTEGEMAGVGAGVSKTV
jgi:hypothetical protein